jgi:futalosine hydrolase
MDTSAQSVRGVLFVVAAPAEAKAALRGLGSDGEVTEWMAREVRPGAALLRTGVGKANAAGAVSRAWDANRYRSVVNIGIAGALPGSGVKIGEAIVAEESVFADEGVMTPDGFRTMPELGFGLGPGTIEGVRVKGDAGLIARVRGCVEHAGAISTVSTCSGTDELARIVRDRTGGLAECMEGAAIAQVCARLGAPFVEVRIVSNTTGDRTNQRWDLARSLSRMSAILGRVAIALGCV